MKNQFQQMMQTMLDQQRQANENQARLQAQAHEAQARLQVQMAKKDEDHAREMVRLQTQLIDVLERRPEPIAVAPPGPAHHRGNDPNVLYERFRKRGPKEFAGTKDPMATDDWLEQIENIFEIFTCTGLDLPARASGPGPGTQLSSRTFALGTTGVPKQQGLCRLHGAN